MASVECLQITVLELVAARQALGAHTASPDQLESNRRALVCRQQQLCHKLIDRYLCARDD